MEPPRVLIVGAGALGLTCAWHLSLAGADISFLVRPHRRQDLQRPQKLYCYNDNSIVTLDHYTVYTDPADIAIRHFDFVLLTLDAASCESKDGIKTLAALGHALQGRDTALIVTAVGFGLLPFIQSVTGLRPEQLIQGSMAMLAYQVDRVEMPLPPRVDRALHDSASIAYTRLERRPGFLLCSKPGAIAKPFKALFDRRGVSRCQLVPPLLYAIFTNAFAPSILVSTVAGWPDTRKLTENRELWSLCCDAQREIMSMKAHGLLGKLMALLMTNRRLARSALANEASATDFPYNDFNRFHHGNKVWQQDVNIVERCAEHRREHHQPTTALSALLTRASREENIR